MKARALFLLAAVCLAGCLEVDETVTLYVSPDGKTEFVAFLDNVHSNETVGRKRLDEENNFLQEIRAGKFGGRAFRKTGVRNLKETLVRDHWPYAALMTGKFDEPTAPWKILGFDGVRTVSFEKKGKERKLLLRFPAGESKVDDFPKRFKVVLTEGKFTGASGFDLDASGHIAIPDRKGLTERVNSAEPWTAELRW